MLKGNIGEIVCKQFYIEMLHIASLSCVSSPVCPGKPYSELVISPLFGAELGELLTGGLQQPKASKVPANEWSTNIW